MRLNTEKRTLISLGIVIAGAALFAIYPRQERTLLPADTRQAVPAGENAIYVPDQPPSRAIVIGFAVLAKSGFVVIRAGNTDQGVDVLGRSSLIPAGETNSLSPIPLLRESRDGEVLTAWLYFDDGDNAFDPENDTPVKDTLGEPVMMSFSIDREADVPGAVSL